MCNKETRETLLSSVISLSCFEEHSKFLAKRAQLHDETGMQLRFAGSSMAFRDAADMLWKQLLEVQSEEQSPEVQS